jgi:NADP-dependent 3-hydroxy acid dehydrogenase YdfG
MTWSRMRAAVVVGPWIPRPALDPALLQLLTSMNLFGTLYSCNAVAPIMKQQRSGKIIIGKFGGRDRTFRRWRVCPLRGGEVRYRALHAGSAQNLGLLGINPNCIASGVIATERISRRSFRGEPEQSRSGRVGCSTAARNGRGLRQGGRVPCATCPIM